MWILLSDWSYAADSWRFSRTLCMGTVWFVSLTTFFSLWWYGESLPYFCNSNPIGKCNNGESQAFLRVYSSIIWWMFICRPSFVQKDWCGIFWALPEMTVAFFSSFVGRWSISIKCKCKISSCLQLEYSLNLHLSFVLNIWKLSLLFIRRIKS